MGSFGSAAADRLERLDARAFQKGKLLLPGIWTVAFAAEWCPFCREFVALFAPLAERSPAVIGDVTDLESPLWDDFGLEVVPTVVVFRDGTPVFRRDGVLGEGLGPKDLRDVEFALGPAAAH